MVTEKIYFDANATTPMHQRALAAWNRVETECWYNPSSPFREGGRARRVLREARETLAGILGEGEEARLVFTSGATEANNMVLRWAAEQSARGVHRPGLLVGGAEHPAVRESALAYWPEAEIFVCPVQRDGRVDLREWERLLAGEKPGFATLMAANNETGILQPWQEAARLCAEAGVGYHCDAVQLPGKASLEGLPQCPFYTLSAHKFGGPKGCGVLRVPTRENSFHGQRGGEQEGGVRSGTEAPALAAAMAEALTEVREKWETWAPESGEGRALFEEVLRQTIPGVQILGEGVPRLTNTSFVIFPQGDQLRWVRLLDRQGVMASTGAACATAKEGPSHVLAAMGYEAMEARRSVRFSGLPQYGKAEWEFAAKAVAGAWQKISPA